MTRSAILRTHTLGCKVNQYETEYLREGLAAVGYRDAIGDEPADLCIVNTCTVTGAGDAKSRRVIRRMARNNPDAKIIVMGCYATRAPQEVAKLPGVSEVVIDKRELPDMLGRFGVVDIPTGISHFGSRHRAYVKVQDGCLLRCSFCIIPHVRPKLESRPAEHILSEIRRLADNGYREIVLTGIHLGHYGVDRNRNRPKKEWSRLSSLLEQINNIDADFRVRLSSIEATEVTHELIDVMTSHADRICPHLHISMQSGSDGVLRRMRRRWGSRRFLDRCELLKQSLDYPALTTDVIVGFPGETEEEFQQTCDACRAVGFSKIHIFPFSPRRGTPAAEMPDQVPSPIKADRVRRLAVLEGELQQAYFDGLRGRRLQVLAQSTVSDRPGFMAGTSCRYATVEFPGEMDLEGQLLDVIATSSFSETTKSAVVQAVVASAACSV